MNGLGLFDLGTLPSMHRQARTLRLLAMVVALLIAVCYVARESDWSNFAAAYRQLSLSTYAWVLGLLILGALLACFRLWLIASDIGSPITGVDAIRASSVGSLAGALFFQLLGQTLARSYVLSRSGTPTAATLAMTGYEKAVALMVSLTFGAFGAWVLFGRVTFDVENGGDVLLKLLGAGVAAAGGGYLGWRHCAGTWFSGRWGPVFGKFSRTIVLSTLIQLSTMAAYIVAIREFAPGINPLHLAAASAVVMLTASLPISFAGWGIRELGAVLTLGAIGLAAEKALIVAILIGVISALALIVIAAATYVVRVWAPMRGPAHKPAVQGVDFMTSMAWFLPLAVATTVFFQVHVPVGEGTWVNANLADPFAVCGGLLFLLSSLRERQWPRWWLPHLNGYVIAVTLVLSAGLAIGWQSFGWTAWSFTNRYLGWFVLLAYAATGALLVSTAGKQGQSSFFRTYIGAGTAIALIEIALFAFKNAGVELDEAVSPTRLSGMAGNANAFAFQMSLLLGAALVLLSSRAAVLPVTIAIVAVVLSASRAGIGASAAIVVLVGWLMPERRLLLLQSLILSAMVIGICFLLSLDLHGLISGLSAASNPAPQLSAPVAGPSVVQQPTFLVSSFKPEVSDPGRMITITGGWALFLSHPLFGAGLGAFAEGWRLGHAQVQVIHSTPLWLLAEFGLIGFAIVALPFVHLVLRAIPPTLQRDPTAILIFLICLTFAIMGAVHDMFFQRAFWLFLGACVALRAPRSAPSPQRLPQAPMPMSPLARPLPI